MTAMDPLADWDDPGWQEQGDTAWAAGCRLLQGWWRCQHRVDGSPVPAGPSVAVGNRPTRLVTSMLPPAHSGLNLLTAGAREARDSWQRGGAGLVSPDRFDRNLLSSQPLAFNLFGPFQRRPEALLPWVQTLDDAATGVARVRLEWAPLHQGTSRGGSAFDAAVEYVAGDGRRLLGIECKYAENLAQSSIPSILGHRRADGSRPPTYLAYEAKTSQERGWAPGAAIELDVKRRRQFWLNTLLVQRAAEDFDGGLGIVLSCRADAKAATATEEVRAQLVDPDGWLRWTSYDDLVARLPREPWIDSFVQRYLDFAPVQAVLDERGIREGR